MRSLISLQRESRRFVRCASTIPSREMNLCTAINDALRVALQTDDSAIVFGQDVKFGGVFRCTQSLADEFPSRVFNTPLSECGIAGFGVGYATLGTAIAEVQFADYIFPAIDQIHNELAKFRYRSGNQFSSNLTIRAPCGSVGHGGHYHSQSPEAFLCHSPGLVVVMPSTPASAKGLLLASIRSPDPVVFLEPKALYRTAIENVPEGDYELELGKAKVLQQGRDITIIGYGGQMPVLEKAFDMALRKGISCELIDLQTLVPYDQETLVQSVLKTGKAIVSHEANSMGGWANELAQCIQEHCFWNLQAPVRRVCGYDTHVPLTHERYFLPDEYKVLAAIEDTVEDSK